MEVMYKGRHKETGMWLRRARASESIWTHNEADLFQSAGRVRQSLTSRSKEDLPHLEIIKVFVLSEAEYKTMKVTEF